MPSTTQHPPPHLCSSYGPDWENQPDSPGIDALPPVSHVNATYEIGWNFTLASEIASDLRFLLSQTRQYLSSSYEFNNARAAFLYGQSGKTVFGFRIGNGLHSAGVGSLALKMLQEQLDDGGITASTVAIQLCGSTYDNDHTFGLVATTQGKFSGIQKTLRSWLNGQCAQFDDSKRITGLAYFTTLVELTPNSTNATLNWNQTTSRTTGLTSRAEGECRTVQVKYLEGCPELAVKCGVSGYDELQPRKDFYRTLVPGQYVCCSAGKLPDYRPKPDPDGSCKTWPVHGGGPQVPGTKPPTDGTDISRLNPCPLNAGCDVWGQCGITIEFCTDTGTGPPGTRQEGHERMHLQLRHRYRPRLCSRDFPQDRLFRRIQPRAQVPQRRHAVD